MTSQQIDYILTLAEIKSFSKAAAKLFVTQPSLSLFIKNVESEIGMPLFDRSTNPIQLTEAGRIYVETAKRIKQETEGLERQIADLSNLRIGYFTIGTSSFRASCLLPQSIRTYRSQYKGINVNIVADHIANLKQLLRTGEIDFCIETDSFDKSSYYSESLFSETYYLAVSKDSPFNDGHEDQIITCEEILEDAPSIYTKAGITLSECQKYPFTFMRQGTSLYQIFYSLCKDAGFEPEILTYTTQIETAFHWARTGIAFSFIPDTLIRYGNYAEHPNYYKVNSPTVTQDIVIAYRKNLYISRAMEEYIATLRRLISYGTWSV